MMDKHQITLPRNLTTNMDEEALELMVTTALNLVPLWENCLGPDWQKKMSRERCLELYRRM
jgi:3-deoxy-alpha-D-manno-octulosonate 8-oxidase